MSITLCLRAPLATLLLIFFAPSVSAQARLVDFTLLKPALVRDAITLPDGDLLLAGEISHVGAASTGSTLIRLNDEFHWQPGWGPAIEEALAVVRHPLDGHIYVGGGFTSIDGEERLGLARLNVDGNLDSWRVIAGDGQLPLGKIERIAVLADGDLLISGPRPNESYIWDIIRVSVGSGEYSTVGTANGVILSIKALADGGALVGGEFEFFDGLRRGIARLTPGTLAIDTSFAARPAGAPWSGFQVRDVAIDHLGRIHLAMKGVVAVVNANGVRITNYAAESPLSAESGEQLLLDGTVGIYVLGAQSWDSPLLGYAQYRPVQRFVFVGDQIVRDPSFVTPRAHGRGARLLRSGNDLVLLGSVRSREVDAIGALSLDSNTGSMSGNVETLGSSRAVELFGALPTPDGGAWVFGDFTHSTDARLWGSLKLNRDGRLQPSTPIELPGRVNALAQGADDHIHFTSQVVPSPRPRDWGDQQPEGQWLTARVRMSNGALALGDRSIVQYPRSGVRGDAASTMYTERDALVSTETGSGGVLFSRSLLIGQTAEIQQLEDGSLLLDRNAAPPGAYVESGVIITPPPPQPSVHLLQRIDPSGPMSIGLGRTAPEAGLFVLGGFAVDTQGGNIYASYGSGSGPTEQWSLHRIELAGDPAGSPFGDIEGHLVRSSISLDADSSWIYAGGLGPQSVDQSRAPRIFRVDTALGVIDPAWPMRGGDAFEPRWVRVFGDRIFALAGTATGTWAGFYRTDDVLFEDGFEP